MKYICEIADCDDIIIETEEIENYGPLTLCEEHGLKWFSDYQHSMQSGLPEGLSEKLD